MPETCSGSRRCSSNESQASRGPKDADATLLGNVEYLLQAYILLDARGAQVAADAGHVHTLHGVAALVRQRQHHHCRALLHVLIAGCLQHVNVALAARTCRSCGGSHLCSSKE